MSYGKVLERALQITWRWKILWVLGFLAALGSGGGPGSSGGSTSYTTGGEEWSSWWGQTYYEPYIPAGIVATVVGIMFLALIIGIAIWAVSIIARGGLIAGVQQVEEEGGTSFGQAWRAGARRFWTLFGISFLAAIPILVLVAIGIIVLIVMLVGSGFAFEESDAMGGLGIASSILCCGALCCGGVIVAVILQQIRIYAERAAVLEGLGWIEAFKRGWNVLKANLGPTIIFWLIFFVIGITIYGIVAVVTGATALPFIAFMAEGDAGPWLLAPICGGGLLAILIGALIGAVVETFTSATWTLAYREMTGLASVPAAASAAESLPEPSEEPASEE